MNKEDGILYHFKIYYNQEEKNFSASNLRKKVNIVSETDGYLKVLIIFIYNIYFI